ncbi:cytochrome P450 315a1, mitochondrial [Pectinophora gossypiella]|uniref:cytochrome P450 315a1, mitochondrial n=1 Tax=Pectinophora gossypiella TaxID=13191 RepID=UPI00214EE8A8|nr:cytochrome P450 315a1, mitochondrial [Pectinophora gossypiella]
MFYVKNQILRPANFKFLRRSSTVVENTLFIEDIPHPTSLPVLGTKLNFLFTGSGARLHEYIDRRHKKLGPIFRESLGSSSELVFISDPGLMKALFLNLEGKYPAHILPDPWLLYEKLYGSKRGLLFMNGEEWLNYRRVMNKHILREGVETWLQNPIQETISKFIQNWKSRAETEAFTPDLETEFYRLSTDVIINILLGSKSSIKIDKHYEELLALFSETVKNIFSTTTKLYGLPVNWIQCLNLKSWRDFKDSVDLSLFLAQKLVSEIINKKHDSNGLVAKLCDENISHDMITRIIADFVIAAGDTSAYTTLWILLLLSKNKSMWENQHTNASIHIKNVVKESMRLYPVAPFLTRILPKESKLGLYKLKQGTPIICSIYTSARDEKNFSKANEFLPYRWDRNDPRKQDLKNHTPSASLPFALGARSCIGKKIAMMQLTEVVSQITNNFELQCLNSTEIKPIMSQVLVPDQHIKLLISLKK